MVIVVGAQPPQQDRHGVLGLLDMVGNDRGSKDTKKFGEFGHTKNRVIGLSFEERCESWNERLSASS